MDHGTDAGETLSGRGPVQLKHGFIALVCRSQGDINRGKSFVDSSRDEDLFFKKTYFHVLDRCGRRVLASKLNSVCTMLINFRYC